MKCKTNRAETEDVPSCSRTVAYREFASGHDCLLQNPVTLYSLRQKFCVAVLEGVKSGQGLDAGVGSDSKRTLLCRSRTGC